MLLPSHTLVFRDHTGVFLTLAVSKGTGVVKQRPYVALVAVATFLAPAFLFTT